MMPWKMIGFITILVLVAAFASLNLSNRTDISVGFYSFKDVPVFLSLLIAFLAGAVVMVPFTFGPSARKKRKKKEEAEELKKLRKAKKPIEPQEAVKMTEANEHIEP